MKIAYPKVAHLGHSPADRLAELESVCRLNVAKVLEEAKATTTAWVKHYNETRPSSRLDYLPPVEWRRWQAEISA